MKKHITTSIVIKAPKKNVWDVLMDFEKYPEWNSFITSISGKPIVGNQLSATIQKMKFKPIVLISEPNQELKWIGKLFIKGLFDGEHRFHLSEDKEGNTIFEQSEFFSGILVKLFSKGLDKNTKTGFDRMNKELKKRAESI